MIPSRQSRVMGWHGATHRAPRLICEGGGSRSDCHGPVDLWWSADRREGEEEDEKDRRAGAAAPRELKSGKRKNGLLLIFRTFCYFFRYFLILSVRRSMRASTSPTQGLHKSDPLSMWTWARGLSFWWPRLPWNLYPCNGGSWYVPTPDKRRQAPGVTCQFNLKGDHKESEKRNQD